MITDWFMGFSSAAVSQQWNKWDDRLLNICMSQFITSYKSTKSINMEYKMFIENTYNKGLEKHFYKTILYRIWNI